MTNSATLMSDLSLDVCVHLGVGREKIVTSTATLMSDFSLDVCVHLDVG